jgi:deoxycytidylate deaminase
MESEKKEVKFPYLPEGREILYVDINNPFMIAAKDLCKTSGCVKQSTGAVIVKNGQIIGRGTNAAKLVLECPRWGSPTGENYGPCKDICKQEGHAEAVAVKDMMAHQTDYQDADLYLYGHWWCCRNCWESIINGKIKNVYLLDNSFQLFNPENNPEMQNWGKPKNA